MKIIAEQTGEWDRTKGQNLMTNWLSKGMHFDAVISNNDEMAIGAIQAMKSASVDTKKAVVGGVDATQDALASMKAGDLKVTVFQDTRVRARARSTQRSRSPRASRSRRRSTFPSSW